MEKEGTKSKKSCNSKFIFVYPHTVMCSGLTIQQLQQNKKLTNGTLLRVIDGPRRITYLTSSIYLVLTMFVIYSQIKSELLECFVLFFKNYFKMTYNMRIDMSS